METSQQESNLDRLLKQIEDGTSSLGKMNKQFVEFTKVLQPLIKAEMQSLNSQKEQKQLHTYQKALLKKKNEFDAIAVKQLQETIKLRHQNTIDEEREHGQQVRRNIELRAAMEKTTGSFSLFTNMLGGIGMKSAAGKGIGGIMAFFGAAHKRTSMQTSMSENQSILKTIGEYTGLDKTLAANSGNYDLTQKAIKSGGYEQNEERFMLSRLRMMKKAQKEIDSDSAKLQEGALFGALNKHPLLAKLAQHKYFERIAKWADENKGGIAISLVSMGVFIGLLKKMLDTSPMLGKMFEMFKLMFDLVLRPFGDMIGFFLLPVLKVIMNAVLPWFAKVYPVLIKWGLEMGTLLTTDFGAFLGKIVEYLGIIAGILPASADERGALQSTAVGGLAATAGLAVGGKWALGKLGAKASQKWGASGAVAQFGQVAKKIGSKNLAMFGAKGALKAIPIAGWAWLAAEVGLGALKAINPIAYSELRKNAEWMGMVRDFVLPEHTILEGYGAWAKGEEGTHTGLSGSVEGSHFVDEYTTYNFYGVDTQTSVALVQESSLLAQQKMKDRLNLERDTRFG